ncbi:hypothetical protein KCP70_04525 [Salmonella enterica subsp. enterica]|nr:hypothetical protein KCP70_04525 [Salmonella enterica subsp. enterica]
MLETGTASRYQPIVVFHRPTPGEARGSFTRPPHALFYYNWTLFGPKHVKCFVKPYLDHLPVFRRFIASFSLSSALKSMPKGNIVPAEVAPWRC